MDQNTTIAELSQQILKFTKERGWADYHTPKNLVMSLAIEAAELMEIFQWMTPQDSERIKQDPKLYAHVQEEMADVLAYLLQLAARLDVDLSSAFVDKMAKNAKKYPLGQGNAFGEINPAESGDS